MSNPLLVLWHRLFMPRDEASRARERARVATLDDAQTTNTVFLVLRRMRVPLIVLIAIFSISVLGLTLIPGQDAAGQPARMSLFDAFYFMSYTASTIGFGEIPHPLTVPQRMWVTLSIYLAVVGWAYAIGSLLALLQEHGFRQALARRRIARQVARLPDPFLLVAGYGQTGHLVGRALDDVGRRLVVVDIDPVRIDMLDVESYRTDVPGLIGDAAVPDVLVTAGLRHPRCVGVAVLTNDDEANLAVTLTASLLRPALPVITRTGSTAVGQQMTVLDPSTWVVNPFDRVGDELCLSLRKPAAHQLTQWLTSPPGSTPPPRLPVPPAGRWVVMGDGRFAAEVTADLRADGLAVTQVLTDEVGPDVLADVAGFVAGSDRDSANILAIELARQAAPGLTIAARQCDPANRALYRAMGVQRVLVLAEVAAREVIARMVNPALWRVVSAVPRQQDSWAARLLEQLVDQCGPAVPEVWAVTLQPDQAPTLTDWLAGGTARLGDLMRDPTDRDVRLALVPLLLGHGVDEVLAPDEDLPLAPGDILILAGRSRARRALDMTLHDPATRAYVVDAAMLPTTWLGRQVQRVGGSATS